MISVEKVKGVGSRTSMLLKKLNINTVDDLVTHYPYRYEFIKRSNLKEKCEDDKVIIDGKVEMIPILVRLKGNLNKMNFRLATSTKEIVGVSIFNRAYLKNQLLAQNKFGKQFDDMVEDYIFLVKLKEELQYDIKSNGIRYFTTTGNGFTSSKPNESVPNLLKVNGQMLKILQDLELKAPEENPGGEGDDLL